MAESELTALPVLECTQVPVIVENLMDMAAEFQAKLDYIATLPRTDDGMKAVKALRAEARKEFDVLDEKRKEVKRMVMEPYNKAETIFKSFVTVPFNSLDNACKEFSDSVEGEMKSACETRLKDYFSELTAMKGICWLKWERLGIKVDMATARLKEPAKAMDKIKDFVDRVCSDLNVLSCMEDSAALLAAYSNCLDVAEAIRQVNTMKEAQRVAVENRKFWEARQQQASDLKESVFDAGVLIREENEKKFTVVFSVTATTPMLRGLKAFLESKGYEYEEVDDNV
jgi:hypothetical protein